MHHAISLYVILGQYLATQNAIQQGLVSGTVIKSIEHQSDASDMIAIRIRSPDISIHAVRKYTHENHKITNSVIRICRKTCCCACQLLSRMRTELSPSVCLTASVLCPQLPSF